MTVRDISEAYKGMYLKEELKADALINRMVSDSNISYQGKQNNSFYFVFNTSDNIDKVAHYMMNRYGFTKESRRTRSPFDLTDFTLVSSDRKWRIDGFEDNHSGSGVLFAVEEWDYRDPY